ncbi:MAG: hypothetical protein V2A34_02435 [Lentisphaerota bacterium]
MISVSVNPWLSCSLLLLVQFFLPGLAWSWLFPTPNTPLGRMAEWIRVTAQAILLSLIVSLLFSLVCAEIGWFAGPGRWGIILAVALTGLVAGWIRNRKALIRQGLIGLPSALLLLGGFALVMLLPSRGEWIVGGWDPGIYVNQGVAVSHSGSFTFDPDPVFHRLTARQLPAFTRPAFNFQEAFPVVPLDPIHRNLQHFFFRLFPTFVAIADQSGGLRAATRANEFAGFMAMLVFLAGTLRLTGRWAVAVFALLALLSQSIWVYHVHIPTSEVLQFLLIGGLMFVYPDRGRSYAHASAFALLLLLGVLNRFSFIMFGGMLLGLIAWKDAGRSDRRRVWRERILQLGALGMGALYDFWSNPIALGRLGMVVVTMVSLFALAAILAWWLDHLALYNRLPARLLDAGETWLFPAACLVFLLTAVLSMVLDLPLLQEFHFNLVTVKPFIQPWLLLLALGGAAALARSGHQTMDDARTWILFFLAATCVTLANSEIAALMPWASRRYVEYTVPLLALLAGAALGLTWNQKPARRIAALLGLGLLLAGSARQTAAAWKTTEYNGLSDVLANVAAQLGPEDVVVADHFLWATPLRIIYDRPMVNGELYLDPLMAPSLRKALNVLASWRKEGTRIFFLTSTDRGLDVFPTKIGPVSMVWTSGPFQEQIIRHHKNAGGFTLREKSRVFRLYAWIMDDEGTPKTGEGE